MDTRPFSKAEDIIILEGVKMKYRYAEIGKMLGNRDSRQIAKRYDIIAKRTKSHLKDLPDFTE